MEKHGAVTSQTPVIADFVKQASQQAQQEAARDLTPDEQKVLQQRDIVGRAAARALPPRK